MLKLSLLLDLFLDRTGIRPFSPSPAPPALSDLELLHRECHGALELCLLRKGRIIGYARARLHPSFVWLDPPCGASWATDLLEEALEEHWRFQVRPPT